MNKVAESIPGLNLAIHTPATLMYLHTHRLVLKNKTNDADSLNLRAQPGRCASGSG